MSAIPITLPDQQEDEVDEILRRTGAQKPVPSLAIPTGAVQGVSQDPAIPKDELGPAIPVNAAMPIPVSRSGHAIPVGRVAGIPGYQDPQDSAHPGHWNPANPVGVAQLWNKAENIHNPVLRVAGKIGAGLARGIDVAGSVAAPGIAAEVPGSTLNERTGENRERKQATEDITNQERQAVTAKTQADTYALEHPIPAIKTGEEATLHDLMTGRNGQPQINPDTSRPYSYLEAYEAVKSAGQKPAPVAEADKPLQNRAQLNNALVRRYQVLHPGEPLPPEYTLPETATNGDYARINESLKNEEGAIATQAQRTQSQQNVEESRNLRRQEHDESRQDRLSRQAEQDATKHQTDRDKFVEPLQSAIDNADYQKAYADGGQHTGTGDYQLMLQLQEAIVAGQKAGIRFNQAEQARIENARSLMDSLGATIRHATVGTYFSDQQRKEIAAAMQTVATEHRKQIARWDREHPAPAGAAGKVIIVTPEDMK